MVSRSEWVAGRGLAVAREGQGEGPVREGQLRGGRRDEPAEEKPRPVF